MPRQLTKVPAGIVGQQLTGVEKMSDLFRLIVHEGPDPELEQGEELIRADLQPAVGPGDDGAARS